MKKLYKKGSVLDISSQSIFSLPRILFVILFIIIVTSPIGCYSKNKEQVLEKIKENEAELILNEITSCIEKGFSEQEVSKCFTRNNVGFVVKSESISFVINPSNYKDEFCNPKTKNIICKNRDYLLKTDEEITKINIDMVLNNG